MGKKKATKVEDDVDLPEPSVNKEGSNDQTDDTSKSAEAEKGKVKGKKGKKNRKKDDDDEDMDDLLAELESEYTGVPVKPKSSEVKTDDQTTDEKSKEELMNGSVDKKESSEANLKNDSKKPEGPKKKQEQQEKSKGKQDKKDVDQEKSSKAKKDQKKDSVAKDNKKSTEQKKDKEVDKTAVDKDDVKNQEDKPDAESKKSDKKDKDKDKKKKKGKEEEDKSKKNKPNKKMLEAMKEMIAKKKEEEERLRKEEEERQRLEEERIRQEEEARRLEQEKKERKKQKEKDRIKRLKEEGKYLTPKQKLEQARAKAMLEHLKAQGITIGGDKSAGPPRYGKRPRKKQEVSKQEENKENIQITTEVEDQEEVEEKEEEKEQVEDSDEDIADAWDQSDEDDNEVEDTTEPPSASTDVDKADTEEETELASESDDSSDEEVEISKREKVMARIEQRKLDNEKNKDQNYLRAPVVCVLGHVDHGKTKILDKLRKTNVQDGEVGGITQQIGATNVPGQAIESQTRMVKNFSMKSITFPGLLIIDTPGHESFSNLRSRGSSLCDIAILVVDITQGLEPQTIESINLLKSRKTPFVVALNKVDRVFEWESYPSEDVRDVIKKQSNAASNDFDRRKTEILSALNMQGLNAALFWENPDPRSYVSLVPTSAISGDGMGNLMSLVCSMCQTRLTKRLVYTEELQCTVLEVKTIQGHGVTIDVILVNGRLREGDTIVLAGTEGPIVTQIRSLLLPKPCKEIRVKGQYDEFKEIKAAQGVKIAAKELEKAIAGLNLQVAYHEDEVELLQEEVDREFRSVMRSMKVKDRGVYVQASTLGALEALLEFFKANNVPYSGIRVGPVVKKDVMKATAMLEHDPMYAVILAFDVKVERDAQELADREGVRIFSEETIYHLGDRYVEYIKDYKKRKQDEVKHIAVFPCKLKIIPSAVFNKRDPIVIGVTVEAGVIRVGTALCVPSKEFVDIGVVTSLEFDHKAVEIAKKGVDVCIKIEPLPGHTPKLFGRHFDETDILVSKISRESIDACKEHFRDELTKTDWKLMAELKKEFSIL